MLGYKNARRDDKTWARDGHTSTHQRKKVQHLLGLAVLGQDGKHSTHHSRRDPTCKTPDKIGLVEISTMDPEATEAVVDVIELAEFASPESDFQEKAGP